MTIPATWRVSGEMRYAVRMKRYSSLALVLLLACVLVSATASAMTELALPGSSATLSQIEFNATLSINAIRTKLRQSAAEAFRKSPTKPVSVERDGVRVTVTPKVLANNLGLSSSSNGTLVVSVPIRIAVKIEKKGLAHLVGVKGCGDTTFNVSASLDPRITATSGLRFTLGDVKLDNAAYNCSLHVIVKVDDVDTRIRKKLKELGGTAFKTRLHEFNSLLPEEAGLLGMLRKPAEFGGAVTLGIDASRLRIKRVASKGDAYRISGVVEGRPRLLFGDDNWVAQKANPDEVATNAGFRLPARLLFPTDPMLLPDASAHKASGCLGSFRLHPVPRRRDLAVLQRCGPNVGSNVIWLSGANEAPPPEVRVFNRSMTNVLNEIITWLDDPSLWSGVEGISRLRHEVNAFGKLLDAFQEETTIPVDTRGSLHFFDLNMDLTGVWVNGEAIIADVMLTGKARLNIVLSL
jgi:hypothetical protein